MIWTRICRGDYTHDVADVQYHPEFDQQFARLALGDPDVFEDVASLIIALETHGRQIEGTDHTADPSHPIVISRYDMWALRRTPATGFTPTAIGSPILRIPYVWMEDSSRSTYALVFFIGDKTDSGNDWYPSAVNRIENDLLPKWETSHQLHHPKPKRRPTP